MMNLVKPPLKTGDVIWCYCKDKHPIALFAQDGTPLVSCSEALGPGPQEFPALFYDGSIIEIRRVRD